jgi:hypothetical protein
MLSIVGPSKEDVAGLHVWLKSITDEMKLVSFVQTEYLEIQDWDDDTTFAVSVSKAWDTSMVPPSLQRFKTTLPNPQPTFAFGFRPSAFDNKQRLGLQHLSQEVLWPIVTVEVAPPGQTCEETSMRCIHAAVIMLESLAAVRKQSGREPAYWDMQVYTVAMDQNSIRIMGHWIDKNGGHEKYSWKTIASWRGVMSSVGESGRVVRSLIKQALGEMLPKIKDDLHAVHEALQESHDVHPGTSQ